MPSLMDLPDAAAAALLSFLDAPSLCAVALCCRNALPPFVEAFQRRFQLRLPPDAPRRRTLPPLVRVLATQFAVADTGHAAAALAPIAHRIHGLAVSSNAYTARPVRSLQWRDLRAFTSLVRLRIAHVWAQAPVDLATLARYAPQLEELVVRHAKRVSGRPAGLLRLRVLHLEDTNCDSFTVALGLPRLTNLALLTPSNAWGCLHRLRDTARLAEVAPLTRLVVRGRWDACPRAALRVHHATLREYAELGATCGSVTPPTRNPAWQEMAHLRVLRFGSHEPTDLAPLAGLRGLEHLQIVVPPAVRHCRALRRLTRLRALHLSNGWVCDLVGYLPRLEALTWEVGPVQPLETQLLWRRDTAPLPATPSALRTLVLCGSVAIDDSDWGVRAMLANVEQLEVNDCRADSVLAAIARLRHLKRLALRHCIDSDNGGWRRVAFACSETLEELYYAPRCLSDEYAPGRVHEPLPLWLGHARGLPRLRVLASPFQESPPALAALCPRLTHLYLPFGRLGAAELAPAPRESLARLCVVSLAISESCQWLRRERGRGRALPSLRCIQHPTSDCLASPWRCPRRATVAYRERDRSRYAMFVMGSSALNPPWRYAMETMQPSVGEERFHPRSESRLARLVRWARG